MCGRGRRIDDSLPSHEDKDGFMARSHEKRPCDGGKMAKLFTDGNCQNRRKDNEDLASHPLEALPQRYKLQGEDNLNWFLGIRVLRDRTRRRIWLSQASCIGKISGLASGRESVRIPMGREELLSYDGCAELNCLKRQSSFMFVSRLPTELKVRLDEERIQIECDNKQTIGLVTKDTLALKSSLRHVDIHNHWLRQEYQRGGIVVKYTESSEMMADGLTKALPRQSFERFRSQMGLVDIRERLQGEGDPGTGTEVIEEDQWHSDED